MARGGCRPYTDGGASVQYLESTYPESTCLPSVSAPSQASESENVHPPSSITGGATFASTILAFGIDTLHFFTSVSMMDVLGFYHRFFEHEFSQLEDGCKVRGVNGYDFGLNVEPGLTFYFPPVSNLGMGIYVICDPAWLRSRSPETIETLLYDVLLSWGFEAGYTRLHPRRVDLAVDFLSPGFPEIDRTEIVSRARSRRLFMEGDRVTGLAVGRGDMSARLYDKLYELRGDEQKLSWMLGIWGLESKPEGQTVLRLEFQLRGKSLFNQWGVDTLWDLLQVQGDIMRYLTGSWLRLAGDESGHDHERRDLPMWAWVREAVKDLRLGTLGVMRAAVRRLPDLKGLRDQLLGVTASYAAAVGVRLGMGRPLSAQELWKDILQVVRWGEWGLKSESRFQAYQMTYV